MKGSWKMLFREKKVFFTILLGFTLSISACGVQPPQAAAAGAVSNGMSENVGAELIESQSDRQGFGLLENGQENWQEELPVYTGEAGIAINGNIPFFTTEEITENVFEEYSELDDLGRCGVAFANVCRELMPTEERGSIGNIRPSGWHTVKYDQIADRYLYNRCHLIGYQLAGENANEKNLITGTRYLNIEGMLPWENLTAKYVEETGNHVLYRVTPCYEGDNLVASGVLMEAFSVEDQGAGVCFNVYCYNVQPGILIDYATGESRLDEAWALSESEDTELSYDYVLNTNTKRFHLPTCSSVEEIHEKNKEYYQGDRETLIEKGYSPCGRCSP